MNTDTTTYEAAVTTFARHARKAMNHLSPGFCREVAIIADTFMVDELRVLSDVGGLLQNMPRIQTMHA